MIKALQKLNAQFTQKRDYSVEDESDTNRRYGFFNLFSKSVLLYPLSFIFFHETS